MFLKRVFSKPPLKTSATEGISDVLESEEKTAESSAGEAVEVDTFSAVYKTLNDEQKEVLHRLVAKENIFITGNAGTGKSYLIKAFDKYCQSNGVKLMKTAPTGIASIAIEGATLHHQFKLSTGLDFSEPKTPPKCLQGVDTLLIEEISMVRIDVFEIIMKKVILENNRRKSSKKSPVQLVFVGDFYQLAPVLTKEEKPYFREHYGEELKDGYCFKSPLWKELNIRTCNLKKVVRQDNADFCAALDKCKKGDTSCLWYIKNNVAKEEIPNGIWVCGKNDTVAKKNDNELSKLDGKLLYAEAIYEGEASKTDRLCDELFAFKVGARVVMIINDAEDKLYQNGSLGTIVDYKKNTISVLLDSGEIATVKQAKFPKTEYVYEEDEETKTGKLVKKVIGAVYQFPMRLGYAITVHKAQGQTYDKMNLMPEIFSNGQLYVALSRCRSIENIYVEGYISQRMVMTSPDVLEFYIEQEKLADINQKTTTIEVPENLVDEVQKYIEYLKLKR